MCALLRHPRAWRSPRFPWNSHLRASAIATLAALSFAVSTGAARAASAADDASTEDLKHLSLEQLMDVQVTSVARHPESLLQAAAAIQVITREQIRRSGATTLAEALRLADNLEVAQKNSHDWGISARGFNTQLANKLLVMIDGRTVYTPLYSGVFWDAQDYLLEDVERIEVISGPGGTLWGSNAVNGVINIITRSAGDTQGAYLEAGGGERPQGLAGARFGGSLAPGVNFRVYGKFLDMNDEVLPSGADPQDGWHQARAGFRVDAVASERDNLSVHGDYYSGTEGLVEPFPIAPGNISTVSGNNVVGRWAHTLSDTSDLSLQTYYDHTHLTLPVAPAILNGVVLAPAGTLRDDLDTYDVDFQHRFAVADHNQIVWGLGYRRTHDVVQNSPGIAFLPPTLDHDLFSAFLQYELRLAPAWSVIVGSKLEHNDYTGYEFEPNVRLQWNVTSNQALWSAISRAARTPSRVDRDLSEPAAGLVVLKGGSDFGSEYVTAYEIGYRGNLSSRLTASVSTYYNDYRDVRSTSFTPATIFPLYLANNVAGHTYGAELSATLQVTDEWSLHLGYDFLDEQLHVRPGQFDLSNARNETSDPENQVSLRSALTVGRIELDASLRWVDELVTNQGPANSPGSLARVPSYADVDTRIAWHLGPHWELSVVGQNLLHDHHPEYGFPGPLRVEIQRSVFGKVAWTP